MVWHKVGFESSKTNDSYPSLPFCLPLLLWISVSYLPFIWHPDVKLQISADRVGVTTVFIAGDRVSKEYFPTFAQAVRSENMETRKARKLDQAKNGSKRDNSRSFVTWPPWRLPTVGLKATSDRMTKRFSKFGRGWPREH